MSTAPTPTETKCAHPACNCPAEPGQQYCSTNCQESMKHGTGSRTECGCNHDACRIAA